MNEYTRRTVNTLNRVKDNYLDDCKILLGISPVDSKLRTFVFTELHAFLLLDIAYIVTKGVPYLQSNFI